MFKKIGCIAVVIYVVVFTATSLLINSASAQDVWVVSENGIDYYVMDETFNNQTQYRDNRQFTVDVKLVRDKEAVIKTFSFRENDGLIQCSIDGEEREFVYKGTLTGQIWEYGLKYLCIDYEVKYD